MSETPDPKILSLRPRRTEVADSGQVCADAMDELDQSYDIHRNAPPARLLNEDGKWQLDPADRGKLMAWAEAHSGFASKNGTPVEPEVEMHRRLV